VNKKTEEKEVRQETYCASREEFAPNGSHPITNNGEERSQARKAKKEDAPLARGAQKQGEAARGKRQKRVQVTIPTFLKN